MFWTTSPAEPDWASCGGNSYRSYSESLTTLWMMAENWPLQRGQTARTLDHSNRHVKQNLWRHVSVIDLLSISPRQMGQVFSSQSGESRPSRLLDRLLVPFFLLLPELLVGGGVFDPAGMTSGVGGHS